MTFPTIRPPDFTGGLCRFDPTMFDFDNAGESKDERAERITTAIAFCHRCPVYRQCKAWLASLPRNEMPSGVVAGYLLNDPASAAIRRATAAKWQRTKAAAQINAQPPNGMAGLETPADTPQTLTEAVSAAFDELELIGV